MSAAAPEDVYYHPDNYRRLKEGELIKMGDVVLSDFDLSPLFSIGPNHKEVGNPYEMHAMDPMARKKD